MLMRHPHPELQLNYDSPHGAIVKDDGVQFSVYSRSATAMRLLLYRKVTDKEPYHVIEFDPDTDRWGDIWSVFVPGVTRGQLYHFQASGPWDPKHGHRFDSSPRHRDLSNAPTNQSD
ncbi:MAG: hypothetical protein AAFP69_24275, partial [Planctomycetota bacterium]